jgi:phosphatidate cytidylyltransferase
LSAPAGFGANLLQRVATALVAIPLLLAALFLGPPLLPVAIVAAAVIQGMRELLRLLDAAGARPLRLSGWIAMAAFFVEAASPVSGVPLWLVAPLVVALGALGARTEHATAVLGAAATLLGAAYLGGMGGAIAGLVVISPVEQGAWRVVLLLATIMTADATAFFVGHGLGRHPLAPRLSPSKTVEGAFGALLGGSVGALAVRAIGLPGLPAAHALAVGVLVAASGIAGDLFESLLKRSAGAKDSGAMFPGHGGMLDRLDSLLFGAPVVYWYFLLVR